MTREACQICEHEKKNGKLPECLECGREAELTYENTGEFVCVKCYHVNRNNRITSAHIAWLEARITELENQ